MRTLIAFLAVSFLVLVPLSAQLQYTSVPKSGEGRFSRASNATFWVNPIFFKPSVFFSSSTMSLRANRKWWRAEAPPLFPTSNTNLTRSIIDAPKEKNAFNSFITASNFLGDNFTTRLLQYEAIFFENPKG